MERPRSRRSFPGRASASAPGEEGTERPRQEEQREEEEEEAAGSASPAAGGATAPGSAALPANSA